MKKIIALTVLLVGLNGFASNVSSMVKNQQNDCNTILKTNNKELIAKSGCCSHHHGVCGCTDGRNQCCDGTLSPTCTCKSIVPIEESNSQGLKL